MFYSFSVTAMMQITCAMKTHLKFSLIINFSKHLQFYTFCPPPPTLRILGEPKSRILPNDRKIAPKIPTAEFLYTGSLNSA